MPKRQPEAIEPEISVSVRVPKRLYRQVRIRAVEQEITVRRFLIDAIQQKLAAS